MRAWGLLGASVLSLLGVCALGLALLLPLALRPVDVGMPAFDASGGLVDGLVLTAKVPFEPRVRAVVRSIEGAVTLGRQTFPVALESSAIGREMRVGRPEEVTARVEVSTLQLLDLSAHAAVSGGKVRFAFEGTVDVEVLGVPISLPVRKELMVDAARLSAQMR
jgi:hypothetical protein